MNAGVEGGVPRQERDVGDTSCLREGVGGGVDPSGLDNNTSNCSVQRRGGSIRSG